MILKKNFSWEWQIQDVIRIFLQSNVESRWILTPFLAKFTLAGWTQLQHRTIIKVSKIILLKNDRSSFNNKILIFMKDGNVQLLFVFIETQYVHKDDMKSLKLMCHKYLKSKQIIKNRICTLYISDNKEIADLAGIRFVYLFSLVIYGSI